MLDLAFGALRRAICPVGRSRQGGAGGEPVSGLLISVIILTDDDPILLVSRRYITSTPGSESFRTIPILSEFVFPNFFPGFIKFKPGRFHKDRQLLHGLD
ncbi:MULTISPECIES: hypothetical protein [unclassified Sinorhizobium]|uniref:hypothetical protein n=1 Tax=unclassified Sinorhizobium TaxID=2613772 RepID=UPI0024C431A5|nr:MULTISPECIES: hypothetical protein [unclassified Sinorhizobium]MDK1376768.1 hypothetical protein [Sinorhizobium sp. 6-70]MDK1479540.1 hypothetical protein [Sinorhizobium sp. 6-117]